MSRIILMGGAEVEIDFNRKKYCECGAGIYFARTKNNKVMPVCEVANGYVSHFSNCPLAFKFRKK